MNSSKKNSQLSKKEPKKTSTQQSVQSKNSQENKSEILANKSSNSIKQDVETPQSQLTLQQEDIKLDQSKHEESPKMSKIVETKIKNEESNGNHSNEKKGNPSIVSQQHSSIDQKKQDSQVLLELQMAERKQKPIMCTQVGHHQNQIIFAYITKSESSKRLLCMQCFKEDTVIDKKQLLEIAKLSLDFGQNELKERRYQLSEQTKEYKKTILAEKQILYKNLQQRTEDIIRVFLATLNETKAIIEKSIDHQIQYRIEMVSKFMERQISALTNEEIVEKVLFSKDNIPVDQMEKELNEKFTAKGFVMFDQYNRKSHDLQRVDYMLNSRITINDNGIESILSEIQEKISLIQAQFIIPDVQKHEQLGVNELILKTQNFSKSMISSQIVEDPKQSNQINIQKQQVVNIICSQDNWIDNFKQQIIDNDWFSQFGIKEIINDWREIQTIDMKPNQLEKYSEQLLASINEKSSNSKLIYIKHQLNEKQIDDPILQNILKLIVQSQNRDDIKNFENNSLIISKDLY